MMKKEYCSAKNFTFNFPLISKTWASLPPSPLSLSLPPLSLSPPLCSPLFWEDLGIRPAHVRLILHKHSRITPYKIRRDVLSLLAKFVEASLRRHRRADRPQKRDETIPF